MILLFDFSLVTSESVGAGEEAVGEKFLFYMSPITRSMFETYFNQAQDQLRQQGFNTM